MGMDHYIFRSSAPISCSSKNSIFYSRHAARDLFSSTRAYGRKHVVTIPPGCVRIVHVRYVSLGMAEGMIKTNSGNEGKKEGKKRIPASTSGCQGFMFLLHSIIQYSRTGHSKDSLTSFRMTNEDEPSQRSLPNEAVTPAFFRVSCTPLQRAVRGKGTQASMGVPLGKVGTHTPARERKREKRECIENG